MTKNLAGLIDHTLLKANTTKAEVMKLLEEAKQYQFASVCINPTWVETAAEFLHNTPEVKAFETKNAIENGANEVDMVINIGALKDRQYDLVETDIKAVVDAAKGKALTKVIIETCLLTDEEKEKACELAVKAGADFVKTSTGFSTGGATIEDVALMRKTVGPEIGVKASGGVRNLEDAEAVIKAGANRIGASSGVEIVNGETSSSSY